MQTLLTSRIHETVTVFSRWHVTLLCTQCFYTGTLGGSVVFGTCKCSFYEMVLHHVLFAVGLGNSNSSWHTTTIVLGVSGAGVLVVLLAVVAVTLFLVRRKRRIQHRR